MKSGGNSLLLQIFLPTCDKVSNRHSEFREPNNIIVISKVHTNELNFQAGTEIKGTFNLWVVLGIFPGLPFH